MSSVANHEQDTPAKRSGSAPAVTARPNTVLTIACVAVFMATLDTFIVNVALPSIATDFGRDSLSRLSWILNAYTIVYGAFLVPAGRLSDRFGQKSGFLAGLALFTLASVACAASPGLWALVASRCAQAVGAALLTPASLGLVLVTIPEPVRPRSVRIWAASGSLAGAAGPVVGGLLIGASWRWIFLLNAPLGIALFIAASRVIPRVEPEKTKRWPDAFGGALLAIAVGALAWGLVEVPALGWLAPSTGTAWLVTLAALAWFLHRSARHPSPVVDLTILHHRAFAWSNVAMVLVSAAFAIHLLSLVLLFQERWHWSALRTGFALAPGPCVVPVFAIVGQRLAKRIPVGTVAGLGAAIIALVAVGFVYLADSYVAGVLPVWIICGVGAGLYYPSLFAIATASLPRHQASTGSAVVNMGRQIGYVLGTSWFVVLVQLARGSANPFVGGWWLAAVVALLGAAAAWRSSHMSESSGAGASLLSSPPPE